MKALIQTDRSSLTISIAAEANKLKADALAFSGLIGKVSNEVQNERAVEAQIKLKGVASAIEKARKDAVAPFLDAQRDVNAMAKSFRKDLDDELMRVAREVGNYQAILSAKRRAEEAARLKELAELERQRQEERAKAKSLEELDKIDERHNQVAQVMAAPPQEPARPKGQVVREDWEITVVDIYALFRAFPLCCKVEPLNSEIRKLLDAGMKVPGVRAEKLTKATVRAHAERVVEV